MLWLLGWVGLMVSSAIVVDFFRLRSQIRNEPKEDPLDSLHKIFIEESNNAHKLELQDWDFAFQCATGKEAFPPKPSTVQGYYEPLAGLRFAGQLSAIEAHQAMRNENYIERQRRQTQQAQGMMNMLGGLGNPFQ